jgi:hypothetical protein
MFDVESGTMLGSTESAIVCEAEREKTADKYKVQECQSRIRISIRTSIFDVESRKINFNLITNRMRQRIPELAE